MGTYLDVLLSMFSFYVAMLGIKVTTEHELRTARLFWNLLVLLAIVWNAFYYWDMVNKIKEQRERGESKDENDDAHNNSTDFPSDNPTNMDMDTAFWYMCFFIML